MTVSMIYDKLIKTEYIVFENNGGFSAPNNSIIGSKKLYITNHGRVLGYDSGGIFSSEQSWEYKRRLKYKFLNLMCYYLIIKRSFYISYFYHSSAVLRLI